MKPTLARVLLVDDDLDIRAVTAALLGSLGYHVIEAADGQAALGLLERESIDVLVLDYAMPGMSGVEVARAVRARRAQVPIVFASGYADTAAIEDLPGPRSTLLRKPYGVAELQRVLQDAMRT